MTQRRLEPRKGFMCRVSVVWEDPSGPKTESGRLEDRSPTGAGISVLKPIALGTKVRISGPRLKLVGIVRNCRSEGGSYFVGVHFEAGDEALTTTDLSP
jgi:PilZ domain